MELSYAHLECYLLQVTPPRDAVLQEMERLAEERGFPIVGPLVGHLLMLLAQAIRAERVLELGSGFGYSAYWFCLALPEGGEVICTEESEADTLLGERFLKQGGFEYKVDYRLGEALEILEQLQGTFDIIFIDLHKRQYPQAFHRALPKLRSGGLLMADNLFWLGQALDPAITDPDTQGIREYTRLIYSSPDLHTTIVPLRDGVAVSLKR